MSHSRKLKLEGASGSCSFLIWEVLASLPKKPQIKIHDLQILRQSNLYHNPDTLCRLVGEVNETTVFVEGQRPEPILTLVLSCHPLHWLG